MQAGSTARRRMGGETGERGGAGQRDQGNTKKSRGHTQGAREQQGARAQSTHRTKKKNNGRTGGHTGRAQRGGRAREVGGTGGQRGRKGTQCLSQRSTMPLTRIEPYRPPPDHQGTDGGAAGGRGRRGSPPEGVSGEAAQVGLQVGRQGGGPEAREGARDTAMARRRPAASTRSRGTTLRGRAGDRGEGRVERGESGYMYSNAG